MVPGLPCASAVARCGNDSRGSAGTKRGCHGSSQQAAQHETSLPLAGCLEQNRSHAMGHTKKYSTGGCNTAAGQVPWSCLVYWCRRSQSFPLYHFKRHFSCNQDVVIPWLPIYSLSFEGQEVYANYPFFAAVKLCNLKFCNRKNMTQSKRDVLSDTSWIFCAETSLLKWIWLRFFQSSDAVEVKIRPHAKVTFDKQPHSRWSQQEGVHFRDSFYTIPTSCVVRNEQPECEPAG